MNTKFNWIQYIRNYKDIRDARICTEMSAVRHYNKYGKNENRTDLDLNHLNLNKENLNKENLNKENLNHLNLNEEKLNKVLIIYVYYERRNEQKNQTNLSFFIKHGLCKSNWSNELDITVLIVINGHKCEVVIPSNLFVLKEDNCSDYEGWYNGIKYMENKVGILYNNYEYLCLMNASTCGPFMEANNSLHWLDPFINKIKLTKSIACSPFINNWKPNQLGLALSCHFTLIKLNPHIINFLTTIQQKNGDYTNTVLGKKKDKNDAIFTGEMGLSKLLLKFNYNICSLYYDKNDIIPDSNNHKIRGEFNIKNENRTVFIKNIWRINSGIYASLPVLYDYCSNFINTSLNQKKINYVDYDYNFLKAETNGITLQDQTFNWDNKKKYYTVHGHAEECVLFPLKTRSNGGIVIYTHYHPEGLVMDYVLESIKMLIYLGYSLLFFTSSECISNVDLPFEINYVKNEGVGTDWRMLLNGLNKIKVNQFKWILFVNDSLILGINV